MDNYKKSAGAWLVGYFVFFAPIFYALDGSVTYGLFQSIIGVGTAVMILLFGERWERCKYE